MSDRISISVIIPTRNRYDYRLQNAIKSINNQTLDSGELEIILIDYGSDLKNRDTFDQIVADQKNDFNNPKMLDIWTDTKNCWNKSHCLNIALKKASGKYIQVCDVDIIFAPNYFETFLNEIVQNEKQILFCNMMDTDETQITKEISYPGDYKEYLSGAIYRGTKLGAPENIPFGSSILFAPKKFIVEINGYDEFYKLWGDEDWDMVKRLELSGLQLKNLSNITSHIHQWHPKFESVGLEDDFENQVQKNREYFLSVNSIVRNENGWGDVGAEK